MGRADAITTIVVVKRTFLDFADVADDELLGEAGDQDTLTTRNLRRVRSDPTLRWRPREALGDEEAKAVSEEAETASASATKDGWSTDVESSDGDRCDPCLAGLWCPSEPPVEGACAMPDSGLMTPPDQESVHPLAACSTCWTQAPGAMGDPTTGGAGQQLGMIAGGCWPEQQAILLVGCSVDMWTGAPAWDQWWDESGPHRPWLAQELGQPPAQRQRGRRQQQQQQQIASGVKPRRGSARKQAASQPVPLAAADRAPQERTTVMLRNLPNNYSRAMLLEMMDAQGFSGLYDFVYLPMDFCTQSNIGYAFVNLADAPTASRFWQVFEGFTDWAIPSRKVCILSWSEPCQGFAENVERYRNSPVMCASVPDEYKPAVFSQGAKVQFPAPLKKLRPPRLRKGASRTLAHAFPESAAAPAQ